MKQKDTLPYHLYTISGLGMNQRLFERLELPFKSVTHLTWLDPLSMSEHLVDYCRRLGARITHTENVVILGCSFGGMVAKEIAQLMPIDRFILISSIKNAHEKPTFFDWLNFFPVHLAAPPALQKVTFPLWSPMFGVKTAEEKAFFSSIFFNESQLFKDWGITQIAKWKNYLPSENTLHLHGDKDLIFPIEKIKDATVIKGGNHGMVVTRADEVSKLIYEFMRKPI
ncbi:MAG: alpha/beta hydrolase [Bacteroidota bacterium]